MRFSLWRQDDNGNRFLMESFTERNAAEARQAKLNRSLHKQIYWISENGAESDEARNALTPEPLTTTEAPP